MSGARSSKRWLRLAPFALVTLFGCAQIIGLDDYTVGGKPSGNAGAGEGGEAGEVSVAGGGSSGRAGSAPVGDAGEAGVINVPGVVGCDGKTEFTPNSQVVRSCILRAGCNPSFNPVRSISTCVTYDTQAALPGEQCNRDSKTCAGYEQCEHTGVAHDDLCGGTAVTRCEGNRAINCDNYLSGDRFFDCEALGGTCALQDYDGTAYADCLLDVPGDVCVGQKSDDSRSFCYTGGTEDVRFYCWEDKPFGASCSALASCIDSADNGEAGAGNLPGGDATCYFSLPKCTSPTVPTCVDDVVNDCSNGSLFKYNCGAVGLGCSIVDTYEYCLAPGCTDADVDTGCVEHCSADGQPWAADTLTPATTSVNLIAVR